MDVIVRLTVPNYIYRFYSGISPHVSGSTAESVMADALSAYAGLLSEEIARQRSKDYPQPEGNSSKSRSR